MKFKFKALDENITLSRVPFDASQPDAVQKALATLGSSPQEIANIVTLIERTNKSLYFNFKGTTDQLKLFFEQYYTSMSWEKLRDKYGREYIDTDDEEIKLLVKVRSFFRDLFFVNSKNIKIDKLNNEQYKIDFIELEKEKIEEITKVYINLDDKITKELKKLNFVLSKKNPNEGNNPVIEKTKASFWIKKM
jgi:hypothetical protein